jgi:hypothetical protein
MFRWLLGIIIGLELFFFLNYMLTGIGVSGYWDTVCNFLCATLFPVPEDLLPGSAIIPDPLMYSEHFEIIRAGEIITALGYRMRKGLPFPPTFPAGFPTNGQGWCDPLKTLLLKGFGKKDLPKNCAVIRPGCKALRVGNIEYIHRSEQRSSRVEGQARLG